MKTVLEQIKMEILSRFAGACLRYEVLQTIPSKGSLSVYVPIAGRTAVAALPIGRLIADQPYDADCKISRQIVGRFVNQLQVELDDLIWQAAGREQITD